MHKDSTDFMLEEYHQIATAFFGLRDQLNEWFKAYLILVGFPLTLLAAAARVTQNPPITTLDDIPEAVTWLLIVISVLGLLVSITIINVRMEMLLYARTVNGVRRYFAALDAEDGARVTKLSEHLVLPTTDSVPPFYEVWRSTFLQVWIIGTLDAAILAVGLHNLFGLLWPWSVLVGIGFAVAHWFAYWWAAKKRERSWTVRFPEGLNPHDI